MSNTSQRVLSALVLIAIVIVAMSLGPKAVLVLVFFIGLIIVDELYLNFLKKKRGDSGYFLAMSFFSFSYLYFNFINPITVLYNSALYLAIFLNVFLTIFLFKDLGSLEKKIVRFLSTYSVWIGFYVTILLLCLATPILAPDWSKRVTLILLINFSADSFAWFFGKNFGRRKLMPRVSPKKTVEGAIGGIVSSVILGSVFWSSFIGSLSLGVIISFGLIAVFSVIGDLVQSKLKRLFKIKDSSGLIPGHGGLYDRLDSLLFVMPLYVILLLPKA